MDKYQRRMCIYLVVGCLWAALAIFLWLSRQELLYIVMCVSLMASCFCFAYSANRERRYVALHGDPTEPGGAQPGDAQEETQGEDDQA